MASSQYTKGLHKIINRSIDLLNDNIKLVLVDTASYTPVFDTHEFLTDIPSGMRVAVSANLQSKTITIDSSLSPSQIMFSALGGSFSSVAGSPTEAVVLYKDTGVASTSPLIAYYDNASVALVPNGNDVTFTVSASGLLRWARTSL